MKNVTRNLSLSASQMNASKARVILFFVTLAMFVVAAGAPECGGGFIR